MQSTSKLLSVARKMKLRIAVSTAISTLALSLAGLVPVAAQAQAASDRWQWEVAMYGWFPAIGGSTSYPSGGAGPSFDVSSEDVIDALKFALMGQIEARKGKWGVWSDLVYSDMGGSQSGSRDFTVGQQRVGVDANLSLDIKTWVWTLAGIYNLESSPQSTVDVLFGTRLLDLDETLNWTLSNDIAQLPGRSGSANVSASNWDAIVGIKGRYSFGDERGWFLPYYLDIGTGQSKFTWQINAGVGYKFDWGSVVATWRYLDYQFKSGSTIDGMNMNGPLIGAAFQF